MLKFQLQRFVMLYTFCNCIIISICIFFACIYRVSLIKITLFKILLLWCFWFTIYIKPVRSETYVLVEFFNYAVVGIQVLIDI